MKVRKISLTLRILIINLAILVISTAVIGIVSVLQSRATTDELVKQRMLDISNTAAFNLDGDVLASLGEGDEGTEAYQSQLDILAVFRDHTDLEYIYCMKQTGPESFIFTIDADPEDPAAMGPSLQRLYAGVRFGE